MIPHVVLVSTPVGMWGPCFFSASHRDHDDIAFFEPLSNVITWEIKGVIDFFLNHLCASFRIDLGHLLIQFKKIVKINVDKNGDII